MTYLRAFIAAALLIGCSNSSRATEVLEDQGFTHIHITGYQPFVCAESDTTCTGFTARSPSGHAVRGAVGCGLITKGCTIRFN